MDLIDVLSRLKARYPEDRDVVELEKIIKSSGDSPIGCNLLLKIDEMIRNRILEHEMRKPHHSGYSYYPNWGKVWCSDNVNWGTSITTTSGTASSTSGTTAEYSCP
jgi:hypothetical protein